MHLLKKCGTSLTAVNENHMGLPSWSNTAAFAKEHASNEIIGLLLGL